MNQNNFDEKHERKIEAKRSIISISIQTILVTINITIILALIVWSSNTFRTSDSIPTINPITPAKVAQFGGFSGIVNVGLYIEEFQQFSIEENAFTFDAMVWFRFEPDVISLETLEKFTFENGTILQRSQPDTQIIDGQLNVRYTVRVQCTSNLEYKTFPLDDHRIYIMLANRFIEPSEVIFESSRREFNIEQDMSFRGWIKVDKNVETGYIDSQLDSFDPTKEIIYPAVLFSIDYARSSVRYVFSILLPLAIMFYVSLFTLSLSLRDSLPITAGIVTAILAYRFIIEYLSPRVGYFMGSDLIFFLFLGASVGVFILNVAEFIGKVHLSKKVKTFILILFHLIVIGGMLFLVLW